MIKMLQILIA